MRFMEFVGNASTTASLNGKRLGHDVAAVAYVNASDDVVIQLESNGKKVKQAEAITMSPEDFDIWKSDHQDNLFVHAIELFGATTSFRK